MPSDARAKRKRAAVRSAKRSRTNTWWYGLTALVVIVGVALIVYARNSAPSPVGPYVAGSSHTTDTHWHAALGVYYCDHWLGDSTGEGLWTWPYATPGGSPARAGNTSAYAGLHSHGDGIIHMEPAVSAEAGRNATVGLYFEYGGWKLSSTSFSFLGTTVTNGDKCGGKPGTVQWATARWDRTAGPQKYTVQTGDPSKYKLYDDDIVVIAFLPEGKTIQSIGNPPSLAKLGSATNTETPPGQMPPVAQSPTTAATPATTVKPSTATTKPASATPTSQP